MPPPAGDAMQHFLGPVAARISCIHEFDAKSQRTSSYEIERQPILQPSLDRKKMFDHTPATPSAAHYENLQDGDKSLDDYGITTGAWGAGFCACFDHLVPNCFMAWLCPWVTLAQITSRMGIASFSIALLVFLGIWVSALVLNILARVTSSFFLLLVPLLALYILLVWQLRVRIRSRFRIPGSPIQDLLLSSCCGCCAVAQMASHVKSYEPGNCYCGPVDALPPYES